jgi:YbbR domain-containing protein
MVSPTEKFFVKEEHKEFLKQVFRQIFLEDWTTKLIALVITLALWLGVSGLRAPKTERLRNVALNLRVSNDVEITNSPVSEIDIIVTGDERKIEQINPRDLVASLDLTDVQPGERSVQITPENINITLPTGVKLEGVQPDKIAVKLEKVEEREVPVRVETEGTLAEGFEVYQQAALPQKVRVRAPESYIKSLDFISTEKISVQDKKEDFVAKQIGLNIVNPKVKLLDTVVDVVFRIGEKRVERLFLVPLKTEESNKNVTVVLYGARSTLDNLRTEDLQVEVIKNESGTDSLNLKIPAEFEGKVEIRKLKIN